MNLFRLSAVAAFGMAIGLSAPASAAIITFGGLDDNVGVGGARPNSDAAAAAFDAAAPGSSIVTFEGLPLGNFGTMGVGSGVTVSLTNTDAAPHLCPGICDTNDTILGYDTTVPGKNYLRAVPIFSGGNVLVTFSFATAIDAFGFYYTGTETGTVGTFAIQFNDGLFHVLNLAENSGSGGVGFFGFTDFGTLINSVTLVEIGPFAGSRDIWGIDDVRVHAAVPEPAAMLILGAGLAGLGFARRRGA